MRGELIYNPGLGCTIEMAIEEALKKAVLLGSDIMLKFNDMDLFVHPDSSQSDMETIYNLRCQISKLKSDRGEG